MATTEKYQVFNMENGESHGCFDSISEARGCVEFDKLKTYDIWRGDEIVESVDDNIILHA